jgi:5'-3' exonuclease
MLLKIESETNTIIDNVVFVFDIGKSEYRLGMWHQYKAGRSYSSVPDNFKEIYETVLPEMCGYYGINPFPIMGVEADDLAGILTNKINDDIVLLSGDQDWYQLVFRKDNVRIFDLKKYRLLDAEAVAELTGCVSESQFLIKKCIVGDAGDHIIGVPSIGNVKFKLWADKHFHNTDLEYLKTEFLSLCSSTKVDKTHSKYASVGITTCEQLLDFNLKLGTIMKDLSLLSKLQKEAVKHFYSKVGTYVINIDKIHKITEEYSKDYKGPFGQQHTVNPTTISYFTGDYK